MNAERIKLVVAIGLLAVAVGILTWYCWPAKAERAGSDRGPMAKVTCPSCGATKEVPWDLLKATLKVQPGVRTYQVPCDKCPAQANVNVPREAMEVTGPNGG